MATWTELTPAQRLRALYARAKPQGMGMMHFIPGPLSEADAAAFLEITTYADYLKGRVMKIDVAKPEPDYRLFDRDNGQGAGAAAIAEFTG